MSVEKIPDIGEKLLSLGERVIENTDGIMEAVEFADSHSDKLSKFFKQSLKIL